jgi:hypothetical protein
MLYIGAKWLIVLLSAGFQFFYRRGPFVHGPKVFQNVKP